MKAWEKLVTSQNPSSVATLVMLTVGSRSRTIARSHSTAFRSSRSVVPSAARWRLSVLVETANSAATQALFARDGFKDRR